MVITSELSLLAIKNTASGRFQKLYTPEGEKYHFTVWPGQISVQSEMPLKAVFAPVSYTHLGICKEEAMMEYEEGMAKSDAIPYYDSLLPEEPLEVTEAIRLLLRQTFVLERKYEKRSGRFT